MGSLSIDLKRAHLTRQHGDIFAVYSWCNDERALFLIPVYRKGSAWFVVMESAAYRYDNTQYLARMAAKAAEVLGMEPSPNNWIKLATIINEGLPDLITMPSAPDPELQRAASGHMELRADGQFMTGQEVHMPVAVPEYE